MFLDIKGAVAADTVRADNQLVARDVSFTLPGINLVSAEVKAMGDMSVPIIGLMEHMEMTIQKIGIDNGLSRMSRLISQNFEFRWVQSVVKADGSVTQEGCKAFVRTLPSNVPGLGVEVGSTTEGEFTYGVTRVEVIINGVQLLLVDRLSQILRINGVDHMAQIRNLL
jgi:phage tail tube protein FII